MDEPSALHSWHPGVKEVQAKVGYTTYGDRMSYRATIDYLPQQHREFYANNVAFLPLTFLDSKSRPWCSFFFPDEEKDFFLRSPNERHVNFHARTWKGDPAEWTLLKDKDRKKIKIPDDPYSSGEEGVILTAGLGIELSTRRRNKLAGRVEGLDVKEMGEEIRIAGRIHAEQVLGNCPKYIPLHKLTKHACHPRMVASSLGSQGPLPLSTQAVEVIHRSSLYFFGTSFTSASAVSMEHPPHMGMNERAGRAGFVRFSPSKQTIYAPDYSGNRMMSSLGNVQVDGRCALSFPDFETGELLHVTAKARVLVGEEARKIMPRFKRAILVEAEVEDWILLEDALPVRDFEGKEEEGRSPYSPPVFHLLEEEIAKGFVQTDGDGKEVLLEKIELLLPEERANETNEDRIARTNLGVFRFRLLEDKGQTTATPYAWKAGQYAILDWSAFAGVPEYRHMAYGNEQSVNDESVRSWTISSISSPENTFELTMRLVPEGRITGMLFDVAKALYIRRPELLADLRQLNIKTKLVGVAGDFYPSDEEKTLWVSGGVGITPFLSFLKDALNQKKKLDIVWAVQSREPNIWADLINKILSEKPNDFGLSIAITFFSPTIGNDRTENMTWLTTLATFPGVTANLRKGRVESVFMKAVEGVKSRSIFVCGPAAMENAVIGMLGQDGVDVTKIRRENFNF
ncbi:hypothetical protein BT69DRAFT_1307583 [Atractiella rhizophila]|nr:hypothetical protein BT69DRAFT_1307583 [Atractiella rhizophila]